MTLMLALVLLAGPAAGSQWTATIEHTSNLVAKVTLQSKRQVKKSNATMRLPMTLKVEKAGPTCPQQVSLVPRVGSLGPMTLRNDGGVGVLIFKEQPQEPNTPRSLRGYLGQLVEEDPDRRAMSSCGEGSAAATERWLRRTTAHIFLGDPSDMVLSHVKVVCSVLKGRTQHEVSFEGALPQGINVNRFSAKGAVTVDPAVWVTTWKFGGPLSVGGDNAVRLQVDGTFSSRFDLTR